MSEQETSYMSQLIRLLDEGKPLSDALGELPEEFRDQASEYAELMRWMESERNSIIAPASLLEKIISSVPAEEKKIPASKPLLSETLPAKAKNPPKAQTVDSFSSRTAGQEAPRALAQIADPKLSWKAYFSSDSVLGKPLRITDWKALVPTTLVLLILILTGSRQLSGQPATVAPEPAGDAFAVNTATIPENASGTPAAPATQPAAGPKTAARTAAAMPLAALPAQSTIDDKISMLSAAADSEAAAANSNDSDLAQSNTMLISSAANSYDENAL